MFKILSRRFSSTFTIQSFNNRCEFRSDTFTLPSDESRKAAYLSQCGDNVWQTDLTTIELENQLASLFNKQKALFFPSGTMANLVALMIHAQNHSFILGDESHIYKNEQGGISSIGGITPRLVKNTSTGGMNIQDLKQHINEPNIHQVQNKGISVEVTHNVCNGDIPDNLVEIIQFSREQNWKIHLDGARIFNAMVVKNWQGSEIGEMFDSMTISLSKAVGGVIGSVLIGDQDFIEQARWKRKLLGGGMRQTGFVTSQALHSLKDWRQRIEMDHFRAQQLTEGLKIQGIQLHKTASNMVKFQVDGVKAKDFCQWLEKSDIGMAQVRGSEVIRACLHQNINDYHVQKAIEKVREGVIHFQKSK